MINPKTKFLTVLTIILIASVFFIWNQKQGQKEILNQVQDDTISIVSTDPKPLDEATILPNQSLTINFNKAFDTSRLKIRLEPEKALEIKIAKANTPTDTITISFKEPLQLGSGYTLFINPDPANAEKLPLEKDYIFHFKTIGYRGV